MPRLPNCIGLVTLYQAIKHPPPISNFLSSPKETSYQVTSDFLLAFPLLAEKVQGQQLPQERALKKNRRFRERATRTNAMSLSGWLLRPASTSCLLSLFLWRT
ncbi:Exocyst complex component SEC6 [Zea mays]|uniref:Exocyst complex component SEC6 n=1 Tax=Zea mays TaxID=4577 RepID=A0A1D6HKJ3_MAIZE|nr:Exocyst complex component SEC6 [Zea mays]